MTNIDNLDDVVRESLDQIQICFIEVQRKLLHFA